MRILQLCNRIPYPPHDGGAIAMLNMTRGFHTAGHDVHLLCLNTHKHHTDIDDLPPLFKALAGFSAVDINTDVKKTDAAINLLFTRKSYNIVRFYSSAFNALLKKVLQAYDFDIIQLEGLHIA